MCLGFCRTGAHPWCNRKVTLKERKIPPLQEYTSPSPLFFKVSESSMRRLWEVNLERTSQLDNDWKVVGVEDREGVSLRIQGYVGGSYCEDGRGGVSAIGDACERIEVEEKEVCEGFCDPTSF